MQRFEYKVVPAPKKGEKAKGAKTTADRFAVALTNVMNTLGAEGWDYVRADTLPCDERVGLTGTKSVFQNMLVFRRLVVIAVPEQPAKFLPAPIPQELFSDPEPETLEPISQIEVETEKKPQTAE
jgi:hypothetical protein